jgi:hypothetical protein
MWEAMHGEMAGMYEVRLKSGCWLYRLFCSLERTGTDVGLAGPAIMLIDGRTPERTEIRKTEYAKIRALYDRCGNEFLEASWLPRIDSVQPRARERLHAAPFSVYSRERRGLQPGQCSSSD